MVGVGKLQVELSAQWYDEIEVLRQKSLPMLATSPDPVPAVLLDTLKSPELRALLWLLRVTDPAEYVAQPVWYASIASDLSIAETILLVNIISPISYQLILRFHLIRHRAFLNKLAETRRLSLTTLNPRETVMLTIDVPDLGAQLAQVQQLQKTLVKPDPQQSRFKK